MSTYMQKRTLYSFTKRKVYKEKGYKILPDMLVNEPIMQEQWDDILRFMATIILRETTASQLFQRLNSNQIKRKKPVTFLRIFLLALCR